jgi:hypothetical protein
MPEVNWLAVLAATLSMFVLGAVWYSPLLFVKPWIAAAGLTVDYAKRGNFALILGISFVLTFIMAANLAFFLAGPGTTLAFAIGAALAAGLGWATLSLAVIALFERRPLGYVLINGGYLTVGFALMGLILGLWR